MTSAAIELTTLFQTFSCIKGDTANVDNPAYRLLEQWRKRFSAPQRAVAWNALERQLLKTPSAGARLWLLNAPPHEVSFALKEVVAFPLGVSDQILQALMRRIVSDANNPEVATDAWNSVVEKIYKSLSEELTAAMRNKNVSSVGVAALVDTRRVLDHCNHPWSVALHCGFPVEILDQMAADPKNQHRVKQQQLALQIADVCSNRHNRHDSFKKVQAFFEQISQYSLSEQQNPNGVLFGALQRLCEKMPAPVLKEALQFLRTTGWSPSRFWDVCSQNMVMRACYTQNHEYIDLIVSFSTPQQQTQLFTWVLEGVVQDFNDGSKNNIRLSNQVETILQKDYAQYKPFALKISMGSVISEYHRRVQYTLCDKQFEQANPYTATEEWPTSLEGFFKHTASHFYSDDTYKAVELLKTIDSPSLRGCIDFWGRLHDVDYQLDGLKTLEPLEMQRPRTKIEKVLQAKMKEVQQHINISGSVDTSNALKSSPRKI